MKYTRLFTGADGKSRFGEVDLPAVDYIPAYVKTGIPVARQTDALKAAGIFLREWIPQSKYEWHTAPRRQFVIVTSGALDITPGEGIKRRFGPGEFFLVEDLTGGGHLTELAGNKPAGTIFVPLE
jgi:hypothetical protein